MIGEIVGNYRILEKLGEGGMGEVYKGVDLMLDREVAIKSMRRELAQRPDIVERFRAEAVALAKLNHPNIATLYSFFRQGDGLYMAMEFAQGETLEQIIDRHPQGIPPARAVDWFCQALEAIEHAHLNGVIHRDIKPANMMVSRTGRLKVMDFGIARLLGTGRLTRTGYLVGTVEYMSPEQIRGMECDARSDIYSLGIVLYKMLAGRSPFGGRSEYELLRAQVEEMPSPLGKVVAGAPAFLEGILARALAKLPEDRFQTARQFQDALRTRGSPGFPAPPVPVSPDGEATRLPPIPRAPEVRAPTLVAVPSPAPSWTGSAAVQGPPVPVAGSVLSFRSVWRDYPAAVVVLGAILGMAATLLLFWLLGGAPASVPPEAAREKSLPAVPAEAQSPPPAVPPEPVNPPAPQAPATGGATPPAPAERPALAPSLPPVEREVPEQTPSPPIQAPARRSKAVSPAPAKSPERKAPAETAAKPREFPKARKPVATATDIQAPDSRREYFDSVERDLERFMKTPNKPRRPAGKAGQGGDYFKDLSKDVDRFLRR